MIVHNKGDWKMDRWGDKQTAKIKTSTLAIWYSLFFSSIHLCSNWTDSSFFFFFFNLVCCEWNICPLSWGFFELLSVVPCLRSSAATSQPPPRLLPSLTATNTMPVTSVPCLPHRASLTIIASRHSPTHNAAQWRINQSWKEGSTSVCATASLSPPLSYPSPDPTSLWSNSAAKEDSQ